MGLSHSLDAPDLVFSLFSTFKRQLAIAEMPRTQDLAIFAMTTTMTTEPITSPLCACARGNKYTAEVIITCAARLTLILENSEICKCY